MIRVITASRGSGLWKKLLRVAVIIVSIPILALVAWTGWLVFSLTPGQSAREEKRLLAAIEKNPNDAGLHQKLGELSVRMGRYEKDPVLQKKFCRLSSEEFALALKDATDDITRCSLLPDVATSAFENGEYARAKKVAAEMVARATPPVQHVWQDCNRGNLIHHGHLILGRVALARGNVSVAKQELLLAGQTPGSPELKSFGPNMTLARDLLERGEDEVVLRYFDECAAFWKSGSSMLGEWRKIVEAGGVPYFGANLYY